MTLFGLAFFVTGVFLFIRERRLFARSSFAQATVAGYHEYRNAGSEDNTLMYSLRVEYRLPCGTEVSATEQSGSNRKKYPVGSVIDIQYSNEKPEMFIVRGDYSRMLAIAGLVATGIVMMVLFGYIGITQNSLF